MWPSVLGLLLLSEAVKGMNLRHMFIHAVDKVMQQTLLDDIRECTCDDDDLASEALVASWLSLLPFYRGIHQPL